MSNLLNDETRKYDILHGKSYYGNHTPRKEWFSTTSKIEFIQKTLSIIKSSRSTLDIGCGKGSFMNHFNKILGVKNIDGIDISKVAIENANKGIRNRMTIGSCSSMPYKDKSYDVVYQFDGMEHIPVEIEHDTIEEQFRVARKYIIHSICTSPDEHHDKIVNDSNLSNAHINLKTPEEWKAFFNEYCEKHNASIIIFDTSFEHHVNIILEIN